MTDKILWGQAGDGQEQVTMGTYREPVLWLSSEAAQDMGDGTTWEPRPLGVTLDAYQALRDALAGAIKHHPWCAHGGTVAHVKFKPECRQCKAELAALAAADAVLKEAGGEGGTNQP